MDCRGRQRQLNRGRRRQQYTPNGERRRYRDYPAKESKGEGLDLKNPTGVARNAKGNLLVADLAHHRIWEIRVK